MNKLIPKFRIGAKIRKAQQGLYVDESLDDGKYLGENPDFNTAIRGVVSKRTGKYVDLVDKANKRMKGIQTFKTLQDVRDFQKKIGLTGNDIDGDIGGKTINAYYNWVNGLNKPKDPLVDKGDIPDYQEGVYYGDEDGYYHDYGFYNTRLINGNHEITYVNSDTPGTLDISQYIDSGKRIKLPGYSQAYYLVSDDSANGYMIYSGRHTDANGNVSYNQSDRTTRTITNNNSNNSNNIFTTFFNWLTSPTDEKRALDLRIARNNA